MSVTSMSAKKSMCRGRSGFTLIEVLVVMAIIAVLISLLLPGLNRTKELLHLTTCQNNMRQLGYGFMRYAQDNNDSYPFCAVNALPEDWVWWQSWRNPQGGGIAPYIGNRFNPLLYQCPDDDVSTHSGWPTGEYPFSYSLNINIGGYWPSGDNALPDWDSYLGRYYYTLHTGAVKHPSHCMLLIDETEGTLDDGCWAWQYSFGAGQNVLAARHDQINRELRNDPNNPTAGRGNVLFCDGHVDFVPRADSWNRMYWDPSQ